MCKNRLRNQPSDQESCESSPLSPYAVEKTDGEKKRVRLQKLIVPTRTPPPLRLLGFLRNGDGLQCRLNL
jgi:hypothetical protein